MNGFTMLVLQDLQDVAHIEDNPWFATVDSIGDEKCHALAFAERRLGRTIKTVERIRGSNRRSVDAQADPRGARVLEQSVRDIEHALRLRQPLASYYLKGRGGVRPRISGGFR